MAKRIDRAVKSVRAIAETALWNPDARTPEQRREEGMRLREEVPIEAHAAWEPPAERPDPVELLKGQGANRVQSLLPVRYERMSASAFTFYRGGALIMASDLSTTPLTGIDVQACGDAHISNFGLFFSPERRTVFDINDFDETSQGPWEWDIKRLAASVEICGRDRGFSKKERKAAVLACAKAYREAMSRFAEMGNLDVWYFHIDADALFAELSGKVSKRQAKKAAKVIGKAKRKGSARAVVKLTEVVDGKLRIVSDPPLIVPLRDMVSSRSNAIIDRFDMERVVRLALGEYLRTLSPDKRRLVESYRGLDVAHKVVGVGSVGMRALIIVMQGSDADDPLVLQLKEAQESVLERFCGKNSAGHHGERVVEGQRAIQTASDMLLGWCTLPGEDGKPKEYYVRQLWDGKGSIDLDLIDAAQLASLATACGATLAHAHARTGDRFEIAGYLGDDAAFDKAMVKFARAYADQNERDYTRFMEAIEAGELA